MRPGEPKLTRPGKSETTVAMRVAVLRSPGRIELAEVERPEPGSDGVVLRVRAALTCGTDLKAYRRGHPLWPMPTRLGHEFAGEVAAVGREVRGIREGDAVMAAPTGPCGACLWCRKRQENLCETLIDEMVLGGYGEYVRLPARVLRSNVHPKPASLSFAEAALLEPFACVVFGLADARVDPDDTAVVIGTGAIALLHVAALRARGVGDVRVVARNPRRSAAARALGATAVYELDAANAEPAILEGTGGRGADLVVECTGDPEVWELAPRLARRGGEVILFGGCPGGTRVAFDAGRLHYEQVRLRSPFHFTPQAVREARERLAAGEVPFGSILGETLPLDRVEEGLRSMQEGCAIKVVIEP